MPTVLLLLKWEPLTLILAVVRVAETTPTLMVGGAWAGRAAAIVMARTEPAISNLVRRESRGRFMGCVLWWRVTPRSIGCWRSASMKMGRGAATRRRPRKVGVLFTDPRARRQLVIVSFMPRFSVCAVVLVMVAPAQAAPRRVAVIGAQMVHSDKLQRSQEWPAMLQK